MKEDKYRAYDAQNNKMIYYTWEDLISAAVATGYCNHEIPDNIHDLIRIAEYDYSEQMRMKYTGKKDKNGKEIYEGDIIYKELLSPDDMACGFYGAIGVVEEDPCGMGWAITAVDEGDKSFYDRMGANFSFNEIEIRGNKYENPELIE